MPDGVDDGRGEVGKENGVSSRMIKIELKSTQV
jgi:hypothetical protein